MQLLSRTFRFALLAATVLAPPTLPGRPLAEVPASGTATLPYGGGVVVVCPAGDGQTLESSQSTVLVELRDAAGEPCVDFPAQDIWIEGAVPGEIFLCPGGAARAEANTDELGQAVIRGTMFGGGQTEVGVMVFVAGQPFVEEALPVRIKSQDIVGDGSVDLGDIAAFSSDLAQGVGYRSDFVLFGQVNMFDIGVLVSHLGHRCP